MEPELFGCFLPVFWVLSQHEGRDVYYQVGIFSVGFCHSCSSPLGLIWLKGSVERVLVTLVCWIKPRLPAGTPSFPSSWNPSFHGTPPQAFSPAPTPRFFPLKYPEQRHPTVGLPTFPPCQVTFPYNQVFSSQVRWLPGNTNLQVKKPAFSETSVLLKWFGVGGWPSFLIKQLHYEIECSYTQLR